MTTTKHLRRTPLRMRGGDFLLPRGGASVRLAAASALIAAIVALMAATPAPLAAQDLVLTNARVVDVIDGSVSGPATVIVEDGRITRIVEGEEVDAPPGATTVDLMGRYLAPGLMDAHVHVGSAADARRALYMGVTTMRSMGTSHYADVGMRELQAAGHLEAPQYLAAGYHVRPPAAEAFFQDHPELGHMYGEEVRGEEAVRAMTRALVSRGVDFVKTNATERAGLPDTDPRKQFYSEAELRAIVTEAGAAGVPVAAHAHGDDGARAAVAAGVRSIEHGTYISPETLALMVEKGTFLVPTIAIVRDLTIPGGDYDNAVLNIRGRHMLPRVREMARNAHEMGVKIVAATDTGYGIREHDHVGARAPGAGRDRHDPARGAPGRDDHGRGTLRPDRPGRRDPTRARSRPDRPRAQSPRRHRRGAGRADGRQRREGGGEAWGLAGREAGVVGPGGLLAAPRLQMSTVLYIM